MRIFITGASSGLGKALATAYAKQGASLGLLGRNTGALEELAASLPGQHRVYALDILNRSALHEAARDFLAQGPVDIVIACAGISIGTLTEYEEDFVQFQKVINTNLLAMVATFEPFIKSMKARDSGTLVGISSVAGVRGLPGSSAYSASKAATTTYLESLRVDLHNTRLKVVTIAPGFIDTPMTQHNPYKMPFLMQPEDFADAALKAIDKGCSYTVIPWQMGVVAKLLKWIPNPVYDYFAFKSGRKPRNGSLS
ncbi:SDR family oxidoreductase [Advenella alkanexedens]|jgi:short-subunit dehydrogenase|uniref:SDR family oxidoreductase n=1 Tax=Advenella alkanexedens TaxID=1481665 RepID=A0ABS6NN76_9BURK|nr:MULTISPECIES: SDR family oxidoreductase [Advenella]MBV4397085.1 SDR family oxidoreductase [Advenella alkanexedens]MDD3756780.1 SDR family oxidoreductase [Advenella sp.]NLN67772.1 SDR family oxidoreductase [Alcaligenaceae bacterium]WKU20445.1 SDR family oxidoreductase [Advenella alkanexedens]